MIHIAAASAPPRPQIGCATTAFGLNIARPPSIFVPQQQRAGSARVARVEADDVSRSHERASAGERHRYQTCQARASRQETAKAARRTDKAITLGATVVRSQSCVAPSLQAPVAGGGSARQARRCRSCTAKTAHKRQLIDFPRQLSGKRRYSALATSEHL